MVVLVCCLHIHTSHRSKSFNFSVQQFHYLLKSRLSVVLIRISRRLYPFPPCMQSPQAGRRLGPGGLWLAETVPWGPGVAAVPCLPQSPVFPQHKPWLPPSPRGLRAQINVRTVKEWPTLLPGLCTKHLAGTVSLNSIKPEQDKHLDSDRLQIGHLHNHHTLGTSQQVTVPKAVTVPLHATWSSTPNVLHTSSSIQTFSRASQEGRPAWSKHMLPCPSSPSSALQQGTQQPGLSIVPQWGCACVAALQKLGLQHPDQQYPS